MPEHSGQPPSTVPMNLPSAACLLLLSAASPHAAETQPEAQASARHARVDASEGTKLDPLSKANRAFDLNSPKTVPNLR